MWLWSCCTWTHDFSIQWTIVQMKRLKLRLERCAHKNHLQEFKLTIWRVFGFTLRYGIFPCKFVSWLNLILGFPWLGQSDLPIKRKKHRNSLVSQLMWVQKWWNMWPPICCTTDPPSKQKKQKFRHILSLVAKWNMIFC